MEMDWRHANITVSPYTLIPRSVTLGVRSIKMARGFLLRLQWSSGQVGYADCFPWPELGDDPLEIQRLRLKQKKTTLLLEQSLTFAQVDAAARAAGRSVFCESSGKWLAMP